jgi:hypothetical protein
VPLRFQGRDFLKLAELRPERTGSRADAAAEPRRRRADGEVIESEHVVFHDEGDNRMHTEKAAPAPTTP